MTRALAITDRGEAPAVRDVPVADPQPGQVRVAVSAASINGIDAFTAAGYVWDSMPHEFPVILGRDFAGTVDAIGDGVSSVSVGDTVAGVVTALDLYIGVLAEQIIFDADRVVRVPDGVTPKQAAAVGLAGVSARDLVDALKLSGDDVVLVSGATGGVGALAVQLANVTGATVLGTARPGAEDFVRDLGATHVVDHTGDLAAAVHEVAPGGLTAVVHAAGDARQLGALLRPGGRLASVVGATDEQVGRVDVTVIPVLATGTPDKVLGLLNAVASGELKVPVSQTFPLNDAVAAVAAFGQHKQGKLVVTID
jgi:NADPH:quinone reductase-like Zn-dependent oxidoreductase